MPLGFHRILVFDDKVDDGTRIAKSIWDAGYSVRFIKSDPVSLRNAKVKKLQGVRVIFMDINLLGHGIVTTSNFSTVQQAISTYLDERNGPYALITWSSFGDEANNLFDYLKERMPVNLKPLIYKTLRKEEADTTLMTKVKKYLKELDAINCLIDWEGGVQQAACDTIYELVDMARSIPDKEMKDAIKIVLSKLARAEAGDHLDKHNAINHLNGVLVQILYDRAVNHMRVDRRCGGLIWSGRNEAAGEGWQQKVNTMLHLDLTGPRGTQEHMPGDVYRYPGHGHGLPIPELKNIYRFINDEFKAVIRQNLTPEEKKKVKRDSRLLLVEIIPACDHFSSKLVWHRYVVAARIGCEFLNSDVVKKRKSPDYLWSSPVFQEANLPKFIIFFNSKLIVSIPRKKSLQRRIGSRLFRVRQPLLGDMLGWLARQSSRLGHVSVSP